MLSHEQALERARSALARLRAGESFSDLARTLSDGPYAASGGHLGVIGAGQLAPQLEEAAFRLAPGAHSELIEAPDGWHLFERTL
jgi:peptidyl-prolyl cis-trans isomerase C